MMVVSISEAKTHFSKLIRDAENGQTVVITRRGVAVAHVEPILGNSRDAASAIEEWRRFRKERNIRLGPGITIRELIEDGRE